MFRDFFLTLIIISVLITYAVCKSRLFGFKNYRFQNCDVSSQDRQS